MVKRIGTTIRKGRHKLSRSKRDKGKIAIAKHMAQFAIGDTVALAIDSTEQKGTYPLRFHGKTAIVVGQQGSAYSVQLMDGGKVKKFIVKPIHLRRIYGNSQ